MRQTHPSATSTSDRLRQDSYALAASDGRLPGTAGHDRARRYLESRFDEMGLSGYAGASDYRHTFTTGSRTAMTNLVGVVPGTDPGQAPLLIGAHYDSVIAAPCADDNAAGVAIMLEVAARLATEPLQRDVLVAAFDAEEPPHFLGPDMGSNRFVADTLNGPVHLAVILDLVGHQVRIPGLDVDPDLVFVTGAESHPALPGLLDGLDLPVAAAAWSRVGDFSDYAAFRQAGAPYLFFSCAEWEHYHRTSDHPDLLDYAKMARLADDLERVIRRADTVDTAYHAMSDSTDFEVSTLERTIGAETLTAVARVMGRSGYRTSSDLDAIIGGLRCQLR